MIELGLKVQKLVEIATSLKCLDEEKQAETRNRLCLKSLLDDGSKLNPLREEVVRSIQGRLHALHGYRDQALSNLIWEVELEIYSDFNGDLPSPRDGCNASKRIDQGMFGEGGYFRRFAQQLKLITSKEQAFTLLKNFQQGLELHLDAHERERLVETLPAIPGARLIGYGSALSFLVSTKFSIDHYEQVRLSLVSVLVLFNRHLDQPDLTSELDENVSDIRSRDRDDIVRELASRIEEEPTFRFHELPQRVCNEFGIDNDTDVSVLDL